MREMMEEQKLYQYLPMSLQLWILGRPSRTLAAPERDHKVSGVWMGMK